MVFIYQVKFDCSSNSHNRTQGKGGCKSLESILPGERVQEEQSHT